MGRVVVYVLGRDTGALLPSSPLVLVSDKHQVLAHCPSQLSHSISAHRATPLPTPALLVPVEVSSSSFGLEPVCTGAFQPCFRQY